MLIACCVTAPDFAERLEKEDLTLIAVALEILEMSGWSRAAVKEAMHRFRDRVTASRIMLGESQSVRLAAFDEFVDKAAARATAEGFNR